MLLEGLLFLEAPRYWMSGWKHTVPEAIPKGWHSRQVCNIRSLKTIIAAKYIDDVQSELDPTVRSIARSTGDGVSWSFSHFRCTLVSPPWSPKASTVLIHINSGSGQQRVLHPNQLYCGALWKRSRALRPLHVGFLH